ncbi:MAG: Blp family class II bacteriocin [Clostridia bacterium]|nr:Blp family class II bacteriocin [Clostridia bacterium]
MNTNTKELNLNEMEMIAGGDATADRMFNRGCKGAAAGIAVGAAAGSVFPIVGTTGGALIGATVGFIGGLTSGFFDP